MSYVSNLKRGAEFLFQSIGRIRLPTVNQPYRELCRHQITNQLSAQHRPTTRQSIPQPKERRPSMRTREMQAQPPVRITAHRSPKSGLNKMYNGLQSSLRIA